MKDAERIWRLTLHARPCTSRHWTLEQVGAPLIRGAPTCSNVRVCEGLCLCFVTALERSVERSESSGGGVSWFVWEAFEVFTYDERVII